MHLHPDAGLQASELEEDETVPRRAEHGAVLAGRALGNVVETDRDDAGQWADGSFGCGYRSFAIEDGVDW
jgi:hypothetical protein